MRSELKEALAALRSYGLPCLDEADHRQVIHAIFGLLLELDADFWRSHRLLKVSLKGVSRTGSFARPSDPFLIIRPMYDSEAEAWARLTLSVLKASGKPAWSGVTVDESEVGK